MLIIRIQLATPEVVPHSYIFHRLLLNTISSVSFVGEIPDVRVQFHFYLWVEYTHMYIYIYIYLYIYIYMYVCMYNIYIYVCSIQRIVVGVISQLSQGFALHIPMNGQQQDLLSMFNH